MHYGNILILYTDKLATTDLIIKKLNKKNRVPWNMSLAHISSIKGYIVQGHNSLEKGNQDPFKSLSEKLLILT